MTNEYNNLTEAQKAFEESNRFHRWLTKRIQSLTGSYEQINYVDETDTGLEINIDQGYYGSDDINFTWEELLDETDTVYKDRLAAEQRKRDEAASERRKTKLAEDLLEAEADLLEAQEHLARLKAKADA